MKKKIFLGLLIFILIALPLVLICNGKATFPTLSVASAADASHGNDWWRQYGEPKYGGTLIYQKASVQPDLGPYTNWGGLYGCYLETLWKPSWTTSREEWPFTTTFTPGEYFDGMLAESWDQTDPQTLMIHLRKGIHWQDKEPVNGREFVANDVQEHYDRILGKGKYTKPCPLYAPRLGMWKKVTALDKYTVEFKFSYPSAQTFLSVVEQAGQNYIEAPEWMALSESERNDWRKAVGTGPWILTDYIDGSSITYSKNPNYWDYDERHPDNRVPYADELKVLMISDSSTAIAAMRTGKLDLIDELTWLQAKFLADRNPELRKVRIPAFGAGIQPRVDHEPFTDIRVRKALQMAIDRKAIAKSHFGGTIDGIPSGVVNPEYKGYAFAYKDWPDELKAEYSYNPERAKELLARKILRDTDGNISGVLADSKGEAFTVRTCKQDRDPIFCKNPRFLMPLRNPPFYVIKWAASVINTMGGIKINEHTEVLDQQDHPIPGLYAAGVDSGGWESSTYCWLISGHAFGFAVYSGRIAGENAAMFACEK